MRAKKFLGKSCPPALCGTEVTWCLEQHLKTPKYIQPNPDLDPNPSPWLCKNPDLLQQLLLVQFIWSVRFISSHTHQPVRASHFYRGMVQRFSLCLVTIIRNPNQEKAPGGVSWTWMKEQIDQGWFFLSFKGCGEFKFTHFTLFHM